VNTISPASISNRLPPLGGGLVKAEWFKRYRENERPERFDRIMQSWDTANKASELSDFSGCTTWGVSGKNLFLLGLFRRRLEYPAFKRAVREQESQFASPGSTRSAFWAAAPAPRSSAGSKMSPASFSGGLYALAIFGLFAAIVAAICVRETPVAVAQQPIGATAD